MPWKEKTINKTVSRFPLGMVSLFVLAHFCHHVIMALTVPLMPFIRDDFALDYTKAGQVISAFTLAWGISQLPAGWFADRFGPRNAIIIGISGVALCGLLIGLSQSLTAIIIFLVLMGIAGGGYHPAAPPLISATVAPQKRGLALGLHMIGGSGSNFLAPLIGVTIASAWGWHGSYIGMAIPTFIFGIILYILLGRRAAIVKGQPKPEAAESRESTAPTSYSWRRLVAFLVLSTFTAAVIFSIMAFVPLFLVDNFGLSKERAAIYLSVTYFAGILAGPVGGYISDRIGQVRIILAVCFAGGILIYLLGIVAFGMFTFGPLLFLLGSMLTMRMPVSESYIVSQTPEGRRSTILGIYFFAGTEGGGVLTPVVGYLIDRFGFESSFTIAGAALATVTIICAIFLRGSRQQSTTGSIT